MNKQEQINKWMDEALDSVDNLKRARPMPFLLTRVNARLNKTKETIWERAVWLIARPSFAIPVLAMLVLINVMVVVVTGTDQYSSAAEQSALSSSDEFTYTVSTIYDYENIEP